MHITCTNHWLVCAEEYTYWKLVIGTLSTCISEISPITVPKFWVTLLCRVCTAVDSSVGLLRDGNYDYEFSADSVVLRHSPTTVVYALTESTQSTYVIEDVVTTDSKSQIQSIEIAKDGRSVTLVNLNTARTLIYLTILVRDTSTRTWSTAIRR